MHFAPLTTRRAAHCPMKTMWISSIKENLATACGSVRGHNLAPNEREEVRLWLLGQHHRPTLELTAHLAGVEVGAIIAKAEALQADGWHRRHLRLWRGPRGGSEAPADFN